MTLVTSKKLLSVTLLPVDSRPALVRIWPIKSKSPYQSRDAVNITYVLVVLGKHCSKHKILTLDRDHSSLEYDKNQRCKRDSRHQKPTLSDSTSMKGGRSYAGL